VGVTGCSLPLITVVHKVTAVTICNQFKATAVTIFNVIAAAFHTIMKTATDCCQIRASLHPLMTSNGLANHRAIALSSAECRWTIYMGAWGQPPPRTTATKPRITAFYDSCCTVLWNGPKTQDANQPGGLDRSANSSTGMSRRCNITRSSRKGCRPSRP
jgi:hypothetical protein